MEYCVVFTCDHGSCVSDNYYDFVITDGMTDFMVQVLDDTTIEFDPRQLNNVVILDNPDDELKRDLRIPISHHIVTSHELNSFNDTPNKSLCETVHDVINDVYRSSVDARHEMGKYEIVEHVKSSNEVCSHPHYSELLTNFCIGYYFN